MNESDSAPVETLESLESAEVARSAVLIAYLCLLAVTGMPGNILVCVVYRKVYTLSMPKYYIFWLAVNDTVNSFIIILELVSVIRPYSYPSEWLCKITIFLEMWPTMTSGVWLGVISIDRYRKVCQPFGWQIRQHQARNIYIVLVSVAFVVSLPTLVFFGKRDLDLSPHNITGQGCLIREEHFGTLYIRLYGLFLWLIFVSVLILLMFSYVSIGKVVFKQAKRKNSRTGSESQPKPLTEEKTTSMSDGSSGRKPVRHDSIVSDPGLKYRLSRAQSSERSRKSSRASGLQRSTYIMFLISLIFVISFVPYLSLRLVEALDKTYVQSLKESGRAVFNFFLRCYFLNCVVNPFIYCACVAKFRQDVKTLFCRIR